MCPTQVAGRDSPAEVGEEVRVRASERERERSTTFFTHCFDGTAEGALPSAGPAGGAARAGEWLAARALDRPQSAAPLRALARSLAQTPARQLYHGPTGGGRSVGQSRAFTRPAWRHIAKVAKPRRDETRQVPFFRPPPIVKKWNRRFHLLALCSQSGREGGAHRRVHGLVTCRHGGPLLVSFEQLLWARNCTFTNSRWLANQPIEGLGLAMPTNRKSRVPIGASVRPTLCHEQS